MTTVYLTTGGGLLFAVLLAVTLWLVFGRKPRTTAHVVLVRRREDKHGVPQVLTFPSYGAALAKRTELEARPGAHALTITIEPAGGAR